jgi:pyrroline-5-carboxylate reductase
MKCLIVGYGNMGSAIANSLEKSDLFTQVVIVDPKCISTSNVNKILFLQSSSNLKQLDLKPDLILIAVKPQSCNTILEPYKDIATSTTVITSIMAGKKIKFLQKIFGKNAKIARVMPNLGAKVLKSSSLLCFSKNCDNENKDFIKKFCKLFGDFYEVNENKFDEGTVISGCSPAYFYLLCEELARQSEKLGFSAEMSYKIVSQVISATAEIIAQSNYTNIFRDLKNNVASSGGVTRSALDILEPSMQKAFNKATKIAIKRSKFLAKN